MSTAIKSRIGWWLGVAGIAIAPALIAMPATATTRDATASRLSEFKGPIASVNRGRHIFRVNVRSRGIVPIKANRSTRYRQLSGFGALHRGLRVEVKARRSSGKWVAVVVAREKSTPPPSANHPPGFPPQTVHGTYHNQYVIVMGVPRLSAQTVDITISPGATDPDGDALTYQWTASNGSITGSGLSGTWTRVVSNYQPVPGTVTVTARDGKGGTAVLDIHYN